MELADPADVVVIIRDVRSVPIDREDIRPVLLRVCLEAEVKGAVGGVVKLVWGGGDGVRG